MVYCDHAPILHNYGDMALQRLWDHDLDLSGSRDVIGHVTIRLAVGDFLWVIRCDHAFILHRYGDMASKILDARTDGRSGD